MFSVRRTAIVLVLAVSIWGISGNADVPTFDVSKGGVVNEWIILGPFPNPEPDVTLLGAGCRLGFAADFLTSLGGEPHAVIESNTTIAHTDAEGLPATALATRVETDSEKKVNLKDLYGSGGHAAYGFVYLVSDRAQTAYCSFGSNDCAKVWVNGQLKVSFWSNGGRAFIPGQEVFAVELQKGTNPVLVKVEDAGGSAWEFQLSVHLSDRCPAADAAAARVSAIKQFQYAQVIPEEGRGFVLSLGELPDFVWKDAAFVTSLVGEVPLRATWYDAKCRKVTHAKKQGRYAAVVDGEMVDGTPVRRVFTAYCYAQDWQPNVDAIRAYVNRLPVSHGVKNDWVACANRLDDAEIDNPCGFGGQADAMLLAAWDSSADRSTPLYVFESPEALDAEYHLKLRYKLTGAKPASLSAPRVKEGKPAPVLRMATPDEAGVKAGTSEKLDELFNEWYQETNEPFSVMIARNGVILTDESYGPSAVNTETVYSVASVTKVITAFMFAQFVDQGLIGIDDPVGKYLPEFPVEGENVVTLRHCFTHTSGLTGHREYDGLMNPGLIYVLADATAYLRPGTLREYNGMGIDLAGKVMESVSGKSIYRLFEENFFAPLGVAHASVGELGGGLFCSSADLARIGQMVANGGAYGDRIYFGADTLAAFLPRDLSELYPDIDWEWGVGIAPMRQPHPRAGINGVPEDATLLSRNTIGHGASSGTIFRVDLDNQLVIVQCRNNTAPNYEAYVERLMMILDDALLR
jgi:CubicO group peptidase (beta-lactamase class C family)